MIQFTKPQLVLSFIALAALRITIGFHFFDQGHQKYRKGGFDSTGFLSGAEGPFEGLFHPWVPDRDGKIRLCYNPEKKGSSKIDPASTIKIWSLYKNYVVDALIEEEQRLVDRRQQTLLKLKSSDPDSEEYLVLNTSYQNDEEVILAIRATRTSGEANRILEDYKNQLTAYLEGNEEEINFYFQGEARLQGFQRDSDMAAVESRQNKIGDELVDDPSVERQRERIKQSVANRVNLLRAQVKTIQSDRKGAAAGWLATIDGLWKGLEFELLEMVPLDAQRKKDLQIDLPSESRMITMVNNAIPYFDMTIGALLIVGLFTRFAAMGAGLFLLSILMTQPAILGEAASPTTIFYLIEMMAAFVVAATCAGRCAGLDYLINGTIKSIFPQTRTYTR